MDAMHPHARQRKTSPHYSEWDPTRTSTRATTRVISREALNASAFVIKREAAARYREFAAILADHGNDSTADLLDCLAAIESDNAMRLDKNGACMQIPIIDSREYAWLDPDASKPKASAFIFGMMTPRMALEIALHAKQRVKAFFERMRGESRDTPVRMLAVDLARSEQSHIDVLTDALEQLPSPFPVSEDQWADPTIEQQM